MKFAWPVAFSGIVAAMILATLQRHAQDGSQPESPAGRFEQTVRPFFQRHCFECHEGPDAEADLRLDTSADADSVAKDTQKWNLVLKKIRSGEMPPKVTNLYLSMLHRMGAARESFSDSTGELSGLG